MNRPLDCDDVQSLVFSGHGSLPATALLRFAVTVPDEAKASLRALVARHVSFDVPPRGRESAMQLLVTASGMRGLGAAESDVAQLSREFCQGMTASHRRRVLGDGGVGCPDGWTWSDDATHAMVLLYEIDDGAVQQRAAFVREWLEGRGWVEQGSMMARHADREPFGFRDGLSNPRVDLPGRPSVRGDAAVLPVGEFVLGHPFVSGATVPATPLSFNGSYVAVRQIVQDVAGFWSYWRSQAKDDEHAIWLAAKAVGRWPNGMPIAGGDPGPQPGVDESVVQAPLSFANDLAGDDCPLGAHIRRANPRDGLLASPVDSTEITTQHRILRRGRIFGPAPNRSHFVHGVLPDDASCVDGESGESRGLFFIGLCSDLARQFEFIQQTWLNNPKHVSPFDEADPIAPGDFPADVSGRFTIPRLPLRRQVAWMPRFVTVVGGGYFLLPSRSGLRALLGE